MPKTIAIAPADQRQPGALESPSVPLNAYVQDPKAEAKRWGPAALVRVYRDMVLIREFETMLSGVKREGRYGHVAYQHLGPAHLSIGQESAAVGQALALKADDQVFGSHRSHGEILAKCFAAIEELDEAELASTLADYRGGVCHRAVARWSTREGREFAVDFVLYGLLAEVFARDTGLNQGLGGSMHAFFSPFGAMPNNAIVGGSASIATGAALFKRVNRRRGICIANIGDASLGCGPVWESMVFAAMDQYRTLWDPEIGGHPPILFNFMNNFYGMGGQTSGETMGFGVLARVGLGVDSNAMHAERVDGYNPLAVADAIERKTSGTRGGRRPGAARHRHLPPERALALRRIVLSRSRRDRGVAGRGLHRFLPGLSSRERARQGGRAERDRPAVRGEDSPCPGGRGVRRRLATSGRRSGAPSSR